MKKIILILIVIGLMFSKGNVFAQTYAAITPDYSVSNVEDVRIQKTTTTEYIEVLTLKDIDNLIDGRNDLISKRQSEITKLQGEITALESERIIIENEAKKVFLSE